MLTPDYLDTVADPIIEIFSRLQEQILADIARRIQKADYITPTAEWQIIKAQESGMLLKDVMAEIQKTLTLSDTELKELFEQATIENLSGHFKVADIVKLLKRNSKVYGSILAGLEKTSGELKNMTLTTASSWQTEFVNALDNAYWKVNSGAFDYQSAIVSATDEYIENGGEYIHYDSGHVDRIDVAVRRAVLTGLQQTEGKVNEDIAEELGLDYADVSAHMGARPDHAVWQGKRYCISGNDKTFPKLADATGYGTGAGLMGWNCRHNWFPCTKDAPPLYTEERLKEINEQTVSYNGQDIKYYDAEQTMRKAERDIRNLRRKLVGYDAVNENGEYTAQMQKTSAKLKSLEKSYKDFCDQTGLLPQNERFRVYGYNRSLSARAGRLSKEYLAGHRSPTKGLSVQKAPVPSVQPKKSGFSMSFNADDYKDTKMYKTWGKEFTQEVLNRVENAPEDYKKLFSKYIPNMDCENSSSNGVWKAWEKKYYFNKDKVVKGDSVHAPFSTFFHETGHGIDSWVCWDKKIDNSYEAFFSYYFSDNLLGNTIKEEAQRAYEEYAVNNGFKTTYRVKTWESFQRYMWNDAGEIIGQKTSDISDMFNGAYPNAERIFYAGHKKDYWKETYKGEVCNQSIEAFAEMTSATVSNPESLEMIKTYFPKSYDVYLKMLEEMAKDL